jgi:hypothetical protein
MNLNNFFTKFFLDDCESTNTINFVNIIVDGKIIKKMTCNNFYEKDICGVTKRGDKKEIVNIKFPHQDNQMTIVF